MFRVKRPCSDCPFRKVDGIRLHPERAREIANAFVNVDGKHPWSGATFPCHKTVHQDELDEDETERAVDMGSWDLCAGGMLFGLKHDTQSQIVQIGQRLGSLRTEELQGGDEIVDTLDELLALSEQR